MSQKISVPGSLPNSSMPGRIDFTSIFPNEIVTCTSQKSQLEIVTEDVFKEKAQRGSKKPSGLVAHKNQ